MTYDYVRKTFKNLVPTDAALISTALVESGRFAQAVKDGRTFRWSQDHAELVRLLLQEIEQVQAALGAAPTKKAAKAADEEPVTLDIVLRPSLEAGESVLGSREDLKTMLADLIEEGVEYHYAPTDIGWQWSLERVNWSTMSEGDLGRRFKFRATFEGATQGVELGPGGKRKAPRKRPVKEDAKSEAASE